MTSFMTFDSFDDMQRFLQAQEEIANNNIHPKQLETTWGSYWVRALEDSGLLIWGRVWTMEEIMQSEEESADPDYDPDPEHVKQHYEEMDRRGYRFGEAASVLCPEGELGSTHISVMWPITQEEYEKAREAGWNPGDEWFVAMLTRIVQEGS